MCLAVFVFSLVINFVYVGVFKYRLWAGALICFFWGFQETGVALFCNCVLGFEFDSKIVPFAAKNAIQSYSTCAFLFICGYLKTPFLFNLFFGVTAIFGVGAWLILYFLFKFRQGPDDEKERKNSDTFMS